MNDTVARAIDYAMRFTGLPYLWGGDDPIAGFDCSGLTQEILASIGMDPPGDQTAQGLYNYFVTRGSPQRGPGALSFYGSSVGKIIHVAYHVDTERVIEAGGGGSATRRREDAIVQNAYVRIRRYDNRRDYVGSILPQYPGELVAKISRSTRSSTRSRR